MTYFVFCMVAAFAGATMAFQGTLNSSLGKVIGVPQATLVVHIVGSAFAAMTLLVPSLGKGDWAKLAHAPWYAYLGGLLSVVIVYGVAVSIPKLTVSNATTVIIVGQVLTALLIDHFGWFGVEKLSLTWVRGLGLVLLAGGAKLLLAKV